MTAGCDRHDTTNRPGSPISWTPFVYGIFVSLFVYFNCFAVNQWLQYRQRGTVELHHRIDVPVQLVWGEQDRFFPVQWAHDMVANFPNARLDVIQAAGLFAHEERPAQVAVVLLPLLTGRAASPHV